jgi:hypothetical protein
MTAVVETNEKRKHAIGHVAFRQRQCSCFCHRIPKSHASKRAKGMQGFARTPIGVAISPTTMCDCFPLSWHSSPPFIGQCHASANGSTYVTDADGNRTAKSIDTHGDGVLNAGEFRQRVPSDAYLLSALPKRCRQNA